MSCALVVSTPSQPTELCCPVAGWANVGPEPCCPPRPGVGLGRSHTRPGRGLPPPERSCMQSTVVKRSIVLGQQGASVGDATVAAPTGVTHAQREIHCCKGP